MLIPSVIRNAFRALIAPVARGLAAGKVHPNTITILGVIPAILAGYAFALGDVRLGGILLGASGLLDLLDGQVARHGNLMTKFGAILDSTLDRYAEIAVFIGFAVLYRDSNTLYGVVLALGGSLMVSYVKARAEGLGFSCDWGLLQRPERLVILIVGALIGPRYLEWAIWIIAVLANATAFERLLRVRGPMRSGNP
jgi:CDP-diacylglycerol--glycerol-3-phosphate 3-phosphatidyltransferase